MTDENIERESSGDRPGAPLTPAEGEAARPAETSGPATGPESGADRDEGEHDKADAASGTDV